jgi:hypothetical protein
MDRGVGRCIAGHHIFRNSLAEDSRHSDLSAHQIGNAWMSPLRTMPKPVMKEWIFRTKRYPAQNSALLALEACDSVKGQTEVPRSLGDEYVRSEVEAVTPVQTP